MLGCMTCGIRWLISRDMKFAPFYWPVTNIRAWCDKIIIAQIRVRRSESPGACDLFKMMQWNVKNSLHHFGTFSRRKQFWPGTQKMLSKSRKWDYGIHADVPGRLKLYQFPESEQEVNNLSNLFPFGSQLQFCYGKFVGPTIFTQVSLASVAKKLLERTPAPTAWLTTDDVLRPASEDWTWSNG